MAIDLYFSSLSPPSRAVLATAKYLGIEVNVKKLDLAAGETRTAEYLKLNPSHTVPTLVDNGFVLFESRAIMQYLVNKYAAGNTLYPTEARARANVDKILFFDASGYYASLAAAFVPLIIFKKEPTKESLDALKEKIEILETLLGEKNFFTGENVTLADISLGASVPIIKLLFAQFWTDKLELWYQRTLKAVPQLAEVNEQIGK